MFMIHLEVSTPKIDFLEKKSGEENRKILAGMKLMKRGKIKHFKKVVFEQFPGINVKFIMLKV